MSTPLSSHAADLTRIVSCTVAAFWSFLSAKTIACFESSATLAMSALHTAYLLVAIDWLFCD